MNNTTNEDAALVVRVPRACEMVPTTPPPPPPPPLAINR
jgi:hypothetical protein